MPFATHAGVRLHWRWDGAANKPPLVLINSIGTDLTLWDAALPYLIARYHVLRMDVRGHGASDAPVGDYSLALLAQDVLAVMDAAGLKQAPICGLSLGGMIAMELAVTAPDRVSILIPACTSAAIDPSVFGSRATLARERGMTAVADIAIPRFFAESFRRNHPEVVDTVRAGLLATSAEGYAGCCAAIRDMDLASRLSALNIPTLVIASAQDSALPYAGHGERIVAAIPNAVTVEIAGGHLACLENSSEFAKALIDFVDGVTTADANTKAKAVIYDAGLARRREVLGDAWVDRSLAKRTPFNADFQAMITRIAWNEIWTRPGLDERTRRLLVIVITAALGRWEEFRLHVRAGLTRSSFSQNELKEALMQTAIYAGVPAANTAFSEAAEVIAALEKETG